MSPKSQRPPQYWLQWKSHRDRVEAAAAAQRAAVERMILQKDCIRQTPFTPYGNINPSHTPPSLKAYSGIPIYVCEVFGEQGYIPAGKHGIHVGRVCLRGLTPASSRFGERRMRFLAVVLMMGVLMGSGLLSLGSERCLVLCNEGKRCFVPHTKPIAVADAGYYIAQNSYPFGGCSDECDRCSNRSL